MLSELFFSTYFLGKISSRKKVRSDDKPPIKTKMDGKGTALRDGRARAHATLDRVLFLCDPNRFPTTEASTQNFTCRRNSPVWKTYFCFFLQKKNCVCSLYTETDFIIQFSYMNGPLLLYVHSCLWCLITQFSYMYIAYFGQTHAAGLCPSYEIILSHFFAPCLVLFPKPQSSYMREKACGVHLSESERHSVHTMMSSSTHFPERDMSLWLIATK